MAASLECQQATTIHTGDLRACWLNRQCEYEAEVLRQSAGRHDGAHDISHLRRVWRNCERIAELECLVCDKEVLLAAAILHDVVNLPKDSQQRHHASQLSGNHAACFLRDIGFPCHKIAEVRHAIEAHSHSAGIEPESHEARILQDADRLDSLGALGIARTFYVAGQMSQSLYHPDDPFAIKRTPNEISYALDHFTCRVLAIAGQMRTTAGKALARDLAEHTIRFLNQLMLEIE